MMMGFLDIRLETFSPDGADDAGLLALNQRRKRLQARPGA
jgi:hypothetical protein